MYMEKSRKNFTKEKTGDMIISSKEAVAKIPGQVLYFLLRFRKLSLIYYVTHKKTTIIINIL